MIELGLPNYDVSCIKNVLALTAIRWLDENFKMSFYLSGHCFYQPGQRGLRLPTRAGHDQRKHHQGKGTAGHRSHMPLSQLQVNQMGLLRSENSFNAHQ